MQIKPTSEMTVRELTITKLELQSRIAKYKRFMESLEAWERKGLSWKSAIAPLKKKIKREREQDEADLREIKLLLTNKQKTLL